MERSEAERLIRNVRFMPGWTIHHWMADGFMILEVSFLAPDSDNYPNYRERKLAGGRILIYLGDINSEEDFHGRVLMELVKILTHEAREFYRVTPTWQAPFHPHRPDGDAAFGRQLTRLAQPNLARIGT
jgi:hypothetical protein